MTPPLSPLSRRLFRFALGCCPRDFREEHGADLLETLATREAEHQTRRLSLTRFRLRETLAIARAGWRLRRPASRPSRLQGLVGDVRFGTRSLLKHPGHSVVAALTLGVACGAATAVFSVLNAVVLQPLPFAQPDRLVIVRDASPPRFPSFSVSPGRFLEWQVRARVFDGFAATSSGTVTITGGGDPEQLSVSYASANLFDLLGARPAIGRPFTEAEDRPGGPRAVVLSHGLWQSRFGGRSEVVGEIVLLDDTPTEVVGVMPPSFDYPQSTVRAWLPMAFTDGDRVRYGSHYLRVVGRMSSGVSVETAREDLARAARELEAEIPGGNAAWTTLVDPMLEDSIRGVRGGLMLLVVAGAGVLLIACANVAGLLLARGADRKREMALRSALGASRWRLSRQLLIESLLLGVAGACAGVLIAAATLRLLLSASWAAVPRLTEVPLDATTLLFAAGLALLTPLIFGVLPALQLAASSTVAALAAGGRTGGGSLRSRTRASLIVAEVALAVMLVAGSTLLLRSLDRLLRVDPGFEAAGVLTLTVTTPASRYTSDADRTRFRDALVERTRTLPGVDAVATTQSVPFLRDYVASLFIDGDTDPEVPLPSSNFYAVTPGYLDAMGIPLLRGRDISPIDDSRSPRVALVSRQLAMKVFGTLDVLGRQVRPSQGPRRDFAEIVGVVEDIRQYGLDEAATLQIYEPVRQHEYFATQELLVRTDMPAEQAAAMVRAVVRDLDPLLPVSDVTTLSSAMANSTGPRRFTAALLGGLAAIALLLAAVGVYALVSFSVGRRVQEFGVRLALGAAPGSIMRLVVGQGLRLALIGVAIGVTGAVALARFIEAMLFEVSAHDPLALGGAAVVLVSAATLASAAPARRALRVNPVTALRQS